MAGKHRKFISQTTSKKAAYKILVTPNEGKSFNENYLYGHEQTKALKKLAKMKENGEIKDYKIV